MKWESVFLSPFEIEWCQKHNVKLVCAGEPNYPETFYELTPYPKYFFYIGSPVWKTHPLLAVVGSRNPSYESLAWLEKTLSELIANQKVAIVSGGARGVDQKAHQIAIRNGVPTIAFLPSGLMHTYPNELASWLDAIVHSGGAVISQFHPNMRMQKGYFNQRNRLIAAISHSVFIIECKRRSGTWLTAKHAEYLGRPLAVMPTPPWHVGLGGLDLITEGYAQLVRDAKDLSITLNESACLINSKNREKNICEPGGN